MEGPVLKAGEGGGSIDVVEKNYVIKEILTLSIFLHGCLNLTLDLLDLKAGPFCVLEHQGGRPGVKGREACRFGIDDWSVRSADPKDPAFILRFRTQCEGGIKDRDPCYVGTLSSGLE
ncbi:hypothetical protein AVEN_211842-1 [Araneus ventricosus]|uniref:Uncharacterized protein n=1 Tax=Araneus ventricosus TaxID=182803 RepID=A0A4Y2HIT0_ARAVE|nr:hypothetical protein AVEN_211842-1 [Araneus ventricosus]